MIGLTLSRERHALLADCLAAQAELVRESPRFTLYAANGRRHLGSSAALPGDMILVHDFAPTEIDNNICGFVADELMPLLLAAPAPDGYGLSEQQIFERAVGAIVRSIDGNERRAWHLFYDNTLKALARAGGPSGATTGRGLPPRDFLADFAAIYRCAIDLVAEVAPETLLDAATCFGFLPLLLASDAEARGSQQGAMPREIFACDLDPALVSLALDYARARQLTHVRFFRGNILSPDLVAEPMSLPRRFDVVTAIHVLEHLEPSQTSEALTALWSRTGRRLILAVPIEAEPDPRFGHRQVFDPNVLAGIGQQTGGSCRAFEDHGAWLVIDRPAHQEPDQEETG